MSAPLTLDTDITVRVIARDGKFLGDDIGGAHIVIRDALTRELLAEGRTSGGSGLNGTPGNYNSGVMCQALRRGQPINIEGASSFNATLKLDRPRRIEVTAYGPLGALASAHTVSATQWIYPGKPIVAMKQPNGTLAGTGFLLELPGLIVQVIEPVTHYAPAQAPSSLDIRANVAMMCGCPISPKSNGTICTDPAVPQPWLPGEFEVAADVVYVPLGGTAQSGVHVPLTFNPSFDTAGQFTGTYRSPTAPVSLGAGSYQITVYAYQASNGNTGVDTATVFLAK